MSRGKILELLRPDDAGKVQTIYTTEVFGCIRCLAPFRLTGASRCVQVYTPVIYSTNFFHEHSKWKQLLLSLEQSLTCPHRRDYILVGSDSGRIVILEYIKDGNYFKKIHQETFGKSGCRRIVPGQYMAADPKGRACMIGARASLASDVFADDLDT